MQETEKSSIVRDFERLLGDTEYPSSVSEASTDSYSAPYPKAFCNRGDTDWNLLPNLFRYALQLLSRVLRDGSFPLPSTFLPDTLTTSPKLMMLFLSFCSGVS